MKIHICKFFFILLFLSWTSFVCATQPTRIKIALLDNFSLANSVCYDPYGQFLERGVTIAWKDFKREHPNSKFEIDFIKYDLADNRLKAIEVIDQAVKDGAIAALGYICSDAALLGGQRSQELHLPLVTPTATHDSISTIGDYVLMGMFPDSYQGNQLAKFSFQDLKLRKTLIISAADCSYCLSLAKAYRNKFMELGGAIVAEHHVLTSETNYSKLIEQVKTEQYDSVLLPNYAMQSALIIAEFLKNGLDVTFLGGDGWNWTEESFRVISDKRFKGFASTSWVIDQPGNKSTAFLKEHQADYGETAFTTTSHCYDAAMILFLALMDAPKLDRDSVMQSLHHKRKYEGVTGTFIYDNKNYPRKTLVILQMINGVQKIAKVIPPS